MPRAKAGGKGLKIAISGLVSPSPGLSPRVRGNLFISLRQSERTGSIPARAGEPSLMHEISVFKEVYPRACGGTVAAERILAESSGLSPRVRGNREAGSRAPPFCGSIPACAGEPA